MQDGRTHHGFDVRSPFRSYFRIARSITERPERFFREARGSRLWGPTLFVFVTYCMLSLITALIIIPLGIFALPSAMQQSPEVENVFWYGALGMIAVLILTPFLGVFATLVGALIWHPFVALAVGIGRNAGFRETYRISAYQSLPYAASGFVPLVGPLVALVAMGYVGILGVKGAHETTLARSVVSVVAPIALTFLLFVAALAVILHRLASGATL